jgi:lipopolysaccharide exporter
MNVKIIKGALILSLAPLITQLLSFIILPIIARIYAPSDFGIYATVGSAAGVVSVLQGLGYHQAIVLPKSDEMAKAIFNACVTITVFISLAFLLLFFIISNSVELIPQILLEYRQHLFFLVLFEGFYLCLLAYNLRKENFRVISLSRVLRVFVNKFIILLLGLSVVVSPSNLVYADIFATATVCVVLYLGVKKYGLMRNFDLQVAKSILYKYRQFPKFDLPSNILYRSKDAIIIFLTLNFYGSEVVGYYTMALLILTIPATFIGASTGEVFYKEAAENKSKADLQKLSLDLFFALLSSSLAIFAILALYGETLMLFFLGKDWLGVSVIMTVLVIISFNNFMVSPFMNILKIIDRQEFNLGYQLLSIIFSIVGILIGVKYDNFVLSFLLYSLFNLILGSSMLVFIFRVLEIELRSIVMDIGTIFLNILPTIAIFFIHEKFCENTLTSFYIVIIVLSVLLNYYLNYKTISAFRILINYIVISPIQKLWQKK